MLNSQLDLFETTDSNLWHLESSLFSKGYRLVAGVDEAGRGPLAGPVVAAAVAVTEKIDLRGVNDSKQLKAEERERLFDKIMKKKGLLTGVGISTVEEIDRMNILQASLLAFSRAIEALKEKPDFCLLDGNKTSHFINIPQQAIIQGDGRCFLIAAASILAKVTRDRIMNDYDEKWPHYGFKKHKGYGTRLHLKAITDHGLCEIHRRSFEPCKEFSN